MAGMNDPLSSYAKRYDATGDALDQVRRAHGSGHIDDAALKTIVSALDAHSARLRPLAQAEVRYALSGKQGA